MSAVGQQIFGRRQKSLEAKPRGKTQEKNYVRASHYKDFAKPEITHEKSLGALGLIEQLF